MNTITYTNVIANLYQVVLQKQTYLKMIYLWVNIGFGFVYYLILQVCLSVSWGLIYPNISILTSFSLDWVSQLKIAAVVLVGVLIIPSLIVIIQIPVLAEQVLANALLSERSALDTAMWSRDSLLLRPVKLFTTSSAWIRSLHFLLKIPLGTASFFVFTTLFIPVLALFGMPVAYLFGFRNLIIGPWRFDSIEKAILAGIIGIILLPVSLYGMNLLAIISGWLVKVLLAEPNRPK